jgi:hypothetical protein
MEGLFEALLQFLFEFVLEIVGDVIGEILSELPTLLNHSAYKLNLPFEISFFDEITKLDLFE